MRTMRKHRTKRTGRLVTTAAIALAMVAPAPAASAAEIDPDCPKALSSEICDAQAIRDLIDRIDVESPDLHKVWDKINDAVEGRAPDVEDPGELVEALLDLAADLIPDVDPEDAQALAERMLETGGNVIGLIPSPQPIVDALIEQAIDVAEQLPDEGDLLVLAGQLAEAAVDELDDALSAFEDIVALGGEEADSLIGVVGIIPGLIAAAAEGALADAGDTAERAQKMSCWGRGFVSEYRQWQAGWLSYTTDTEYHATCLDEAEYTATAYVNVMTRSDDNAGWTYIGSASDNVDEPGETAHARYATGTNCRNPYCRSYYSYHFVAAGGRLYWGPQAICVGHNCEGTALIL